MGFLKRNWELLVIELISAVVFGGVVAGAILLVDQVREDERFQQAQDLSNEQFEQTRLLANEEYARGASAARTSVYSFAKLDLSEATLSGLELTACPSGQPDEGTTCANFIQADLTGADLTNTDLTGANLTDANLANGVLYFTMLAHATAPGADFHCASVVGTFITDSELHGANFARGVFDLSQFTGSDLTSADFTGAGLSGTNFEGAILDGTVFDGAWYYVGVGAPRGLPEDVLAGLEARDSPIGEC